MDKKGWVDGPNLAIFCPRLVHKKCPWRLEKVSRSSNFTDFIFHAKKTYRESSPTPYRIGVKAALVQPCSKFISRGRSCIQVLAFRRHYQLGSVLLELSLLLEWVSVRQASQYLKLSCCADSSVNSSRVSRLNLKYANQSKSKQV